MVWGRGEEKVGSEGRRLRAEERSKNKATPSGLTGLTLLRIGPFRPGGGWLGSLDVGCGDWYYSWHTGSMHWLNKQMNDTSSL